MQWSVNIQNNTVTFKRQGSTLVTLPDNLATIHLTGPTTVIFTILVMSTHMNPLYTMSLKNERARTLKNMLICI